MPAILRFNAPGGGGSSSGGLLLIGTHSSGVPGGSGVRILRSGQGVFYSQTGAYLPRALTLVSLSYSSENSNANTYRVDLLGDPAQKFGPRFVIASLTIPPNTDALASGALSIPVAQQEVGLQVIRVAGAGGLGGDLWTAAEFEG